MSTARRGKRELKVGFFVIIGLILAISVVFTLGREQNLFERSYSIFCRFQNINGLRQGAPVYMAGLNVGYVHAIRFSDDLNDHSVEIQLKLSRRFKPRVREDSQVSIMTYGLLGDKVIALSPGSIQSKELEAGATIATKEFVGDIFENYNKVAININKILGGENEEINRKSFSGVLKNLDGILQKVNEGQGLVGALIAQREGREVLGNLRAASSSLAEMLNQKGASGAQLKRALHNFADASAHLNQILSKAESGEGTLGALINDPTVYMELRQLLGKANRNKLLRNVVRKTLEAQDEHLHAKP